MSSVAKIGMMVAICVILTTEGGRCLAAFLWLLFGGAEKVLPEIKNLGGYLGCNAFWIGLWLWTINKTKNV